MTGSDVVSRVERYFERQIAWLEEALAAAHDANTHVAPVAPGELERQQARFVQQSDQMLRECEGLLREWSGADISESARAAVQLQTARAAELMAELQRRYDAAAAAAGERLAEINRATSALRQGRDALQRYRPGGDDAPGFVDRKA